MTPGFRYFKCNECRRFQIEICRDANSPSHSYCELCSEILLTTDISDIVFTLDKYGNIDEDTLETLFASEP